MLAKPHNVSLVSMLALMSALLKTKKLLAWTQKVHLLTCKTRHADTSIAMNKVNTGGIVQAGWGYALIYVDFTVIPCKDVTFKSQWSHMSKKCHTAALIRKLSWVTLSFPPQLCVIYVSLDLKPPRVEFEIWYSVTSSIPWLQYIKTVVTKINCQIFHME